MILLELIWKVLKKEYKSIQSSYLPKVSLGADYQRTNKETNSVPDNRTTVQGSVDYIIYDGGKNMILLILMKQR